MVAIFIKSKTQRTLELAQLDTLYMELTYQNLTSLVPTSMLAHPFVLHEYITTSISYSYYVWASDTYAD